MKNVMKTINEYKNIGGFVILIICGFFWYTNVDKALAEQSDMKKAVTQLTQIANDLKSKNDVLLAVLVSDPAKRERIKSLPTEPLVDSLGRLIVPQTIFFQGEEHSYGLMVTFKDSTQAELVWDIRSAKK